jgi:hypothetical protein
MEKCIGSIQRSVRLTGHAVFKTALWRRELEKRLGIAKSLSYAPIYVTLSDAKKRPLDTRNGWQGNDRAF